MTPLPIQIGQYVKLKTHIPFPRLMWGSIQRVIGVREADGLVRLERRHRHRLVACWVPLDCVECVVPKSEAVPDDACILYGQTLIGHMRLKEILPVDIALVLKSAEKLGRAPQTRLHIYNLLHKMFGDAVEMSELLSTNPAKLQLRPEVPKKETAHLTVEQALRLLRHVHGKSFELAIWLNIYVGMRVGEIQALKRKHVDIVAGAIQIRSTYVRKEHRIQDHPKGKEWHTVATPPELTEMLRRSLTDMDPEAFVVRSPRGGMMKYEGYWGALGRYCVEAGIPKVATHGLRHSTSGIYMANGATRDDMYRLFKHSSMKVTERYIHDKGERDHAVAKLIRLFPEPDACKNDGRVLGS